MTHWAGINLFPDELINLNREIRNHPKLQERLANHPMAEWEIKLSEIAHYCDMLLHGDYFPEDLNKIAVHLTRKLIERREYQGGLIVIESSPLQ